MGRSSTLGVATHFLVLTGLKGWLLEFTSGAVVVAVAVGEAAGESCVFDGGMQPLPACSHSGGSCRNKFPALPALFFYLPPNSYQAFPLASSNWESVSEGNCLVLFIVFSLLGMELGKKHTEWLWRPGRLASTEAL